MGEALRALRSYLDVTQTEFAESFGLNQGTYQKYESGERAIPHELIFRLHNLYLFDLNYFYSGRIVFDGEKSKKQLKIQNDVPSEIKELQSRITPEIIRNIKPFSNQPGEIIAFVLCSDAIPELFKAALEFLGETK